MVSCNSAFSKIIDNLNIRSWVHTIKQLEALILQLGALKLWLKDDKKCTSQMSDSWKLCGKVYFLIKCYSLLITPNRSDDFVWRFLSLQCQGIFKYWTLSTFWVILWNFLKFSADIAKNILSINSLDSFFPWVMPALNSCYFTMSSNCIFCFYCFCS